MSHIPGYTLGTAAISRSPVTLAQFETMKATALFGEQDVAALRQSRDILQDQVEDVLDVWYGFVGSTPHLVASFGSAHDGKPHSGYLEAVRKRFARWILDTADASYDQAWLDYQHEIGLRHHRVKKNQTDAVPSTSHVPFRDMFALIFPMMFTLRPFLAKRGHSAAEVEAMYSAWIKSCLLQVTLWSYPYVKDGDF
jgi:Protoglobin